DLEGRRDADQRFDRGARGAPLDLADARRVHVRKLAEVFEGDAELLPCRTDTGPDFSGGCGVNSWHSISVAALAMKHQSANTWGANALCVNALGPGVESRPTHTSVPKSRPAVPS